MSKTYLRKFATFFLLLALPFLRRLTGRPWIKAITIDLDHTVYGCMDYILPAIREWLPIAAKHTGLSVEEIAARLGTVFKAAGTHDYPWAVAIALYPVWQLQGRSYADFVELIEAPYWQLQDEYRERYLRAYPGVLQVLERAKTLGVPVIAVTDSPASIAFAKLLTTGVGAYLTGMVALTTETPVANTVHLCMNIPPAEWLEFGSARLATLMELAKQLPNLKVTTLPSSMEKPDPTGLRTALELVGVSPWRSGHVGDSPWKDVSGAHFAGMLGAWLANEHMPGNLPTEYLYLADEMLKSDSKYLSESDGRGRPLHATRKGKPHRFGQGSFADGINKLLSL